MISNPREGQEVGKVIQLLALQTFTLLAQIDQNTDTLHIKAQCDHFLEIDFHIRDGIKNFLFPHLVHLDHSQAWDKLMANRDTLRNPVVEYVVRQRMGKRQQTRSRHCKAWRHLSHRLLVRS